MQTVKTIALHALIIVVLAVALLYADTLARQRKEFARGEEALARGDLMAAIAGYEAAVHMYTPGSSTVESAAARLWSMGEEFERKGDANGALIAFRALRSSFCAVRWLAQPGREWLERCDGKIAELTQKGKHVH